MTNLAPPPDERHSPGARHDSQIPMDLVRELEQRRAEERQVLAQFLSASLKEQKRQNRGRNAFRLFLALYLVFFAWTALHDPWSLEATEESRDSQGHTAVVPIQGAIMADSDRSAEKLIPVLQKAFADKKTKGVVVKINSPGGSPVQAGLIHDEMVRLQKKYPRIPLYAALEDLCASGGYYVAAAAREIHADKATLVGSIGVILQTFGLEKTLEKVGVENRVLTAGRNKAFLDPFSPMDPDERQHALGLLKKIHTQFIQAVRAGRGDRLKAGDEALFNGLVWTGEEAVGLGLVDGLASVDALARDRIKVEKLKLFEPEKELLEKLTKGLVSASLDHLTGMRSTLGSWHPAVGIAVSP